MQREPAHGIPFRQGRFNARARFIVHSARTSTDPRPHAWPASPACARHPAGIPTGCLCGDERVHNTSPGDPHADIPQRHVLRPSAAAGHAVQRRAVGAFFLLRDAEHPAHLPVLPDHPGRSGHRPGGGGRHRRALWWQRLSGHHSGGLAVRPGVGAGAHAALFRRGGDAGPHRTGSAAGRGRTGLWPGDGGAGQWGRQTVVQHRARLAVR